MVGVLWKVPRQTFTDCGLGSSVTKTRTVISTSGFATEAGQMDRSRKTGLYLSLSLSAKTVHSSLPVLIAM